MVSKKDIKALDFKTIEDYFKYIIDSLINGQKKQAKTLYDKLTIKQKNNFINYINETLGTTAAASNLFNLILTT